MVDVAQPHSSPPERLGSFLGLLACPACSGGLEWANGVLACTSCPVIYPVVNGVPILLPPGVQQVDTGEAACGDEVSRHPYSPKARAIIDAHRDGWVLDLGAGGKLERIEHVLQVDIFAYPCVDVVASADCLPFRDGVFSALLSQAVFEHLRYPENAALEVRRVVRPGGLVKIDTAFLQPEHGYPYHFFNATEAGLRHWFRDLQIHWSGIEPYQHPKWALHWMLGVYLDALQPQARGEVGRRAVSDLFAALDRVAHGAYQSGDAELMAALDALPGHVERALAAGVSIEARVADSVHAPPAEAGLIQGADATGPTALRYRLELALNERNALEALNETGLKNRLNVAQAGRAIEASLHELWVLSQDASRFGAQLAAKGDFGWRQAGRQFLVELAKAFLPPVVWMRLRARRRNAAAAHGATTDQLAKANAPDESSLPDRSPVQFVVMMRPRDSLDLVHQFFSLARQTYPAWTAFVELDASAPPQMRRVASEAAMLDQRLSVREVNAASRWASPGEANARFWEVELQPGVHLAFGALEEIMTLVAAFPNTRTVTTYELEITETPRKAWVTWGRAHADSPALDCTNVVLARQCRSGEQRSSETLQPSSDGGTECLEKPLRRRIVTSGT